MVPKISEIIKRGVPITNWLRNYELQILFEDLVAGITVGLTLIPQSIAYASLAGLSAEYGLYSSLFGGLIYLVFGTIPELFIAPTALISLFTYAYSSHVTFGNVNAAVLLCFLSGVVELLCGVLHLGFLVDFVSTPVVAAFTSAGALTIASSQVKNLLGLKFSAETFFQVWVQVGTHITEINKFDTILGLSCCAILLLMRKMKDFVGSDDSKTSNKILHKVIWFSSVGRNAFVVILSAVFVYCLSIKKIEPFTLTTKVPSGLPGIRNPLAEVHYHNSTLTVFDMMKELGSGIFILPFVSILGNVAIAKSFANGKVVDASQEMIAVGVCNIISSFFNSFPINASFSRAALSSASGVRTPLAGIYTSGMVVLALTFLTPYFSYIPKATLSAVIICAVVFMVEITMTKMIWTISRIDFVPFAVTLICCLTLGIEIGILVGVVTDLIFLLYSIARPKITIEKVTSDNFGDYVEVKPSSSILFPSAEFVREKIVKTSEDFGDTCRCIVINCEKINSIDFTAGKCIGVFIDDFSKLGKEIIFYKVKKPVAKVLKGITHESCRILENENDLGEVLKIQQTYPERVSLSLASEMGKNIASTKL